MPSQIECFMNVEYLKDSRELYNLDLSYSGVLARIAETASIWTKMLDLTITGMRADGVSRLRRSTIMNEKTKVTKRESQSTRKCRTWGWRFRDAPK